MEDSLKHQILAVFVVVLVLLAQCQSIATYKCNNDTNVCGCSRRPSVSLKIIGGQSALFNNWDWIVSFRDLKHHFCGGSILNEWYIITAAHCLENRTNIRSRIRVCAGTFRLSDPCHQSRRMHSIIFHPLYNKTTIENDIALVRLTAPLDFSDSSVTPICLPSADYLDDYLAVGTQVVSIGWGNLETNKTPDELQEVTLKIMNKSSIHCNHLDNDQIQLCAGDPGKGISKGDSGGPLMVLTASKQWELIGLASFVKLNGSAQSGSGYTLITPFLQFIQKHLHKTSIHPTIANCSCQCPYGFDSGYAHSIIDSLDACLVACMAMPSNPCIDTNTYACLGTNCTYSELYNVSEQPLLVHEVFIFPNGNRYEGQTKDGYMHGRGTYIWSDGDRYDGDWIDDNRTGNGILTWTDGAKYVGNWVDNNRVGKGMITFSNGEKYVGDWLNDRKTGQGFYTWSNGNQYMGGFKHGTMHGQGIHIWLNGNKYVGDWIDNHITGKGMLIYANGNKYDGDWVDDYRTGKGTFTWPSGAKYVGNWVNSYRMGKGMITLANGDKYVGDWFNDDMTGEGVYTWLDGDTYEGHFENGERNGWGKMHYSNGTIQVGLWPDGFFTYY